MMKVILNFLRNHGSRLKLCLLVCLVVLLFMKLCVVSSVARREEPLNLSLRKNLLSMMVKRKVKRKWLFGSSIALFALLLFVICVLLL